MATGDDFDGIEAFLKSLGATDEQLAAASSTSQVAALAGDLIFAEGDALTALDLARDTGGDLDEIIAMWRTMGIDVPDPTRTMFSKGDAELIRFMVQSNPVGSYGGELLRVLGSSLSRVAEATVSVYVQTQQPASNAPDLDLLAWAQEQAVVCAAALELGDLMGSVFAHHMREAIQRQRAAQVEVSDRSLYRLSVGFVDLVGFTPLSLHSSPTSLIALVGTFEDKAYEVASTHHGRVVKHIGDEVMFVAPDAASGCAIAADITAAFGSGIEPRGGVCYGDVVARHGDYYGPVVNMASRLADLAVPGEVLTDGATVESARGEFEFHAAGRRQLKGFDDPIELHSVGSALLS